MNSETQSTDIGVDFVDNAIDTGSVQDADEKQANSEHEVVIGSLLFDLDGHAMARRRSRRRASSIL